EDLLRRVDADLGDEFRHVAISGNGANLDLSSTGEFGREQLGQTDDVVSLFAGEAQRVRVLFREKLQRQDAHADEVGTVYALVALGDHGADAEQQRTLGGPIAGRSRTVLFAGENDQRHARDDVFHRRVEDSHDFSAGQILGHAALGLRGQL